MDKKKTTFISIDDIIKNNDNLLEQINNDNSLLSREKSSLILKELINKINPVDFRNYTKIIDENKSLQKKHYLVSVIEILLKIASDNNYNICRKDEMVFLYNTEFWENIEHNEFKDFLGKVALKMGVQKFDAKLHSFKDELYKQFLSDAGFSKLNTNINKTLINLKNGTFEISLKHQKLRPFKQSDFMTYQLPFSYDKKATAPKFEKYLTTVLPQKELQSVLAEYLGYIFIKSSSLKLEKVLLLYGTGANGKSVLFEIISALLGSENTTNFSLQSLTDEKGYQRAMIANKLLNYASEINGKLEASMFKKLISGEPVEARLPYGNPQTITDYAKFIFNTNELPKEVENTNAFFRRFLILPFKVTIPEKEQDAELSKKIISSELSGIFNWILEGLNRLLINKKFTQSDLIKQEVDNYKKESDSTLLFLEEENYKASNENYTTLKEIYTIYKQFCSECNFRPLSRKNFTKRLEENGFYKERKSQGTVFYIEKKFNQ